MNIYVIYNFKREIIKYYSFKIINYDNIIYINCCNNQLTELPRLPNLLEIFWCNNNKLTELPELPNLLKELYCSNNQLTSLPKLPNSLQRLYCYNNELIKFVKHKYLVKIIF